MLTPVHTCLLRINVPFVLALHFVVGLHTCPGSFRQGTGPGLPAHLAEHGSCGDWPAGRASAGADTPNFVPLLPAGRALHPVSDSCLARPAISSLTPLLCCLQTRQSAVYEMTGQQDVPEQKLDMMLVVGGFNSSNTSHLQVGTQGCHLLQGRPRSPLQAGCCQPRALSSALPATPGD